MKYTKMFRCLLISALVVAAQGKQYWDQDGPGSKACGYGLFYGPYEGPTNGAGYGTKGSAADNTYELVFDPPMVECETYPGTDYDDGVYCVYSANTTYTITLQSSVGDTFGGFGVYLTKGQEQSAGSNFSSPSAGAQILTYECNGPGPGPFGMGHTNGNVARTSVSAQWTSPTSAASPTSSVNQLRMIYVVKDSTGLTTGKYFKYRYYFYSSRPTCASSNQECIAPAVVDNDAFCSDNLYRCELSDFGNATTPCCKLPAPATTPAPVPSDPATTPAPTGGGSTPSTDSQNSATNAALSSFLAMFFLFASTQVF